MPSPQRSARDSLDPQLLVTRSSPLYLIGRRHRPRHGLCTRHLCLTFQGEIRRPPAPSITAMQIVGALIAVRACPKPPTRNPSCSSHVHLLQRQWPLSLCAPAQHFPAERSGGRRLEHLRRRGGVCALQRRLDQARLLVDSRALADGGQDTCPLSTAAGSPPPPESPAAMDGPLPGAGFGPGGVCCLTDVPDGRSACLRALCRARRG